MRPAASGTCAYAYTYNGSGELASYTDPLGATTTYSYNGTGLLSIGTILGCVLLPVIAERRGRRQTLGLYFVLMGASIAIAFGYVFYIAPNASRPASTRPARSLTALPGMRQR